MLNHKYIGLALLTAVTFTSCKDDENAIIIPPAEIETLEVKGVNTFCNLSISNDADWSVAKHPTWATPMEDSGTAGSQLKVFIQNHSEDADRTDTVTVNLSNGKVKKYVITQLGLLRDPENGRALAESDMIYTCGVGFCIDVFADNSSSMSKYGIMNITPLDFGKTMAELRRTSQDLTFGEEERYVSRTDNITGSTKKAISDQLAANGNVEVGIEAFKATVEGSFSRKSTAEHNYVYALQEVQHVVKSRYIDGLLLRHWAENGTDVFQEDFANITEALKSNPTNARQIKRLVNMFGTHIITYAGLGGELQITMEMKVDNEVSETDISGALSMGIKAITLSGSGKYTAKEEKIANNTTLKLRTIGGNNAFSLELGSKFDDFQKALRDPETMNNWIEGLKSYKNPQVIDIQFIPIWELMPTTDAREAVRAYIMGDYQKQQLSKAGLDYSPGLYCVKGFNVSSTTARRDSLGMADINHAIIADRKVVAGINGDKMGTFLYSGPLGNINYACAFFVGDNGAKPCKVYFDAEGKVTGTKTIENKEAKPVQAVYIDGTGDITLAPKGQATLYKEVSF